MTIALSRLLREAVARFPEQIALVDTGGEQFTYARLGSMVDALRDALLRQGVYPGDRVGICAPKSIDTVAAIFAIMEAGAAYVPVDPNAPAQRSTGIFDDCSVRLIIADSALVAPLRVAAPGHALETLELLQGGRELLRGMHHEDRDTTSQPYREARDPLPEDLAYILYTSGSTGRPKGVMHTHASSSSFVNWCSDTFAPTQLDRFSSHAPFHFDLSILDLFVSVKHGATLVLIGEDVGKQPMLLAKLIAEQRITIWYSTPSILRLLAQAGRLERYDHSSLRLVLFAGEVFPVKSLRALKAQWTHPRYFNLYGPTETNVCTFLEIPAEVPESRSEPYPIGYTCPNDRTRVVNDVLREVARGEVGELCVSGGTVMLGYWNMPERSADAFLVDEQGTRWYRTGDLVREDADGCYDYLGRRDRMVKRRGYRVELAEVEAALHRHASIAAAAVVASPDQDQGARLDAFIVRSHDDGCTIVELKKFCSANLPAYMIPDRFFFRASLPETSTGKTDYQELVASSPA